MHHQELDRGLINGFQQTEETSTMRASLLALTFGFFLVVGLPFAAIAGPTPGGPDVDSDGIEDAFDNCINVANASQTDSDHDGCGNVCELSCDEALQPENGTVGIAEFNAVATNFQATVPPGTLGDCDGNGTIGVNDFNLVATQFQQNNGPAANTPACDPSRCTCP